MNTDAVIVALIQESIMSNSPVRQMAARMMLDMTRSHQHFAISSAEMDTVRAEAGEEIADEMMALADDLGLEQRGFE